MATQREILRHNSNFRWLLSGQLLSSLGSEAAYLAYPLIALAIGASAAASGAVYAALLAGRICGRLPAGRLVDTTDRRTLMLTADGTRIAAAALLAATLLAGALDVSVLVGVAFFDGAMYALFRTAQTAAMRQILPPSDRAAGVALNEAREFAAVSVGRPVGGLLFSVGRAAPVLLDLATYLVSFATVLRIKGKLLPVGDDEAENSARQRSFAAAWAWMVKTPYYMVTVIWSTVFNFISSAAYLYLVLQSEALGAPGYLIGIVTAVTAVGGLLGSLAAPAVSSRVSLRAAILAVGLIWSVALYALTMSTNAWQLMVVFLLLVLPAPTLITIMGGIDLQVIPNEMQGRVTSLSTLLATIGQPVGPLATGWLLSQDLGDAFLVTCGLVTAGLTLGSTVPPRMGRDAARLEMLAKLETTV